MATRLNQLEIMAVAEDVWRQASRLDIFKQGRYVQDKIKNYLRSFTYNYIDLVNIILDRICKDGLITTTLKKRTLKNLFWIVVAKLPFLSTNKFMSKKMVFLWGHH